jgi:hypothetical protein
MTFGSGGDQPARPATGAFEFGLTPSSQRESGQDGAGPRRNRRRRSGPDRSVVVRSVVIIALSAALLGAAGFVALSLVQQSEQEVKADSAALCTDLGATPGVLSQPGFGWPTDVADLPTTVESMKAYQARWANLAKVGPPSIRADLAFVAEAAGQIASRVESSQSIDRPGNLAEIQAVTSKTDVAAWAAKYCE